MEKRLLELYKEREKGIRKQWDVFFKFVLKPQWEEAWKKWKEAEKAGDEEKAKIAKAKYQQIMRYCTIQDERFRGMIDEVTTKIAHVNEIAVAYINNEIPDIYAINRNGANEYVSSVVADNVKVNLGIRYDLMDAKTAQVLLTDDDFYKPLFKKVNVPKDKRWNRKLIHSQVSQGILGGESIDKIASRIMNVTDANAASAVRNARTMCTAAENRGRMDSYEDMQERGIVLEKIWSAAVGDGRTRDWHLELNGVAKEIDEPFINSAGEIMYPGDPSASGKNIYNCRCALRTHVIGFRKKDGSISKVADYM